jgi:protocatechuate 3,4-dioxygenase alpha subunit
MSLVPTPGQTVGPFFGYALPYDGDSELVPAGHPDAVQLHGLVLDGTGQPIPDALIELWQAAPDGDVPTGAGSLTVFARGLLNRLFTRAYLPEHSGDPFLATVDADRRGTLVAERDASGFVFDIRVQGEGETVFLTYPRH